MRKIQAHFILALLILLMAFFAFGAYDASPTGDQVAVKRTMPPTAPQQITKHTINLGQMKPGIITVGNKKLLLQASKDPLQNSLDAHFRKKPA